MTSLARKNGERVLEWYPGTGESVYSVAHRPQDALASGITFFSNEADFPSGFPPNRTVYVRIITLRDPLARSISHYTHLREIALTNATFADWADAQADNFMFRRLCGAQCNGVPKGRLTPGHVAHVKGILDTFDVILNVDRYHWAGPILRRFLGWHTVDLDENRRGSRNRDRLHYDMIPISPTFYTSNALDVWLFQVAAAASEGAMLRYATHSMYTRGNSHCRTPCCNATSDVKCSPY